MTLYRVSADVSGLGEARLLCEQLPEMLDPAPLATTMFEDQATGGWRVDAYFEGTPDDSHLATTIEALIGRPLTPRIEEVPNENWVAISQAALPPVIAGRYVVHGSHDRARVGRRLNGIEIDAGEAFGTAHHATTLGCLFAIDRLQEWRDYNRILDLGCGSGVLAIAAARGWPHASVLASDIDPVAIDVARANVRNNRLGQRIRAVVATGLTHPSLRGDGRYDLIVANILAGPLILLAPHLRRATAAGGTIVLSGILAEQAAEVIANYRAQGFTLERRHVLNGWVALTMRMLRFPSKRRAAR